MKKIISILAFASSLFLLTACDDWKEPTPLDTRINQGATGNDLGNMPDSAFGDEHGLRGRDGDFNAGGMDWENINPEDIIATVYFGFDQYSVAPSERGKVQSVVSDMKANPSQKVFLVAHTDWYGTEEYNLALSDKRGSSVQSYMFGLGVENERSEIVARGKNGATLDVAKDSPEAKHDRRVDIVKVK